MILPFHDPQERPRRRLLLAVLAAALAGCFIWRIARRR